MASAYDAFISYSHAADGKLAPALQSALQGFAKPWYKRRALRLFRDQTSLALTPELWPEIERALLASRYFLLLASPDAADSRWVQQEVGWWLEHKPPKTLLIVQTAGADLRWDRAANDFAWASADALPPNLKGTFANDPLRLDLRWARDPNTASTKDSRFLDAVATIAATLHGKPKDELIGEDLRQHRRALQLAWGAAVVLVVLLVAAVAAALLAVRNQAEAEAQRDEARRQANIAESRALAAQAVNQVGGQLDLAHLLSLESLASADTAEARGSLLTGLTANPQLIRYLHGGPARVYGLDVSPDGKRIAAAGYDGTIAMWDGGSGQLLGPSLAGEIANIGVAFAPDSQTLASYGGNGVTLLDADSGTPLGPSLARAGQPAGVSSLDFSPDGSTIATTNYQGSVDLWDVASRQPLGEPLDVTEVFVDILVDTAFSPDGSTLAIGSRDGTILLWDVGSGRNSGPPLEGQGPLNQLAFSPDGRTLAAAGDRVILWNLDERVPSEPLVSDVLNENPGFIQSYVAFNPDGSRLAVATCSWLDGYSECSGSDIRLWDVASRQPLNPPLLEHGPDLIDIGFTSVAFNPEGTQLASGTTHKGVLVWDASTGQTPAALVVNRGTLPDGLSSSTSVLSPDGSSLALAIPERSEVVVWDIASDRQRATLTGFTGQATSLAFSRDGALLASAACNRQPNDFSCEQSEIHLWEVRSGAASSGPFVVDDEFVSSLAFSPDGSILASSGGPDNGITLWDVATGVPRQSPLTGHERVARVLAFSPDGAILASGGGNSIFLWNVADGQGRQLPERHTDEVLSLAFSADGTTLASGGRDNAIRIWDVRAGTSQGSPLIGHQAGPSGALGYANAGVFSLGFAADGKTVISGGNDRTIRFWDVARRQPIGSPLTGQGYPVTDLVLSPDNRALVTASLRGEVIVYDIDLDSWRHRACDRANRNLSEAEWARYLSPAPYRATCPELPAGVATPIAAR